MQSTPTQPAGLVEQPGHQALGVSRPRSEGSVEMSLTARPRARTTDAVVRYPAEPGSRDRSVSTIRSRALRAAARNAPSGSTPSSPATPTNA